jgi:hypothetical protein
MELLVLERNQFDARWISELNRNIDFMRDGLRR